MSLNFDFWVPPYDYHPPYCTLSVEGMHFGHFWPPEPLGSVRGGPRIKIFKVKVAFFSLSDLALRPQYKYTLNY